MRYCAWMRLVVLSVLSIFGCGSVGCGSIAATVDAPPAPADAAQADAPQGPRCDPTQPFLNPIPVPNVNSSNNDSVPRLSADELELFFASDRPVTPGLYVARRASRDAQFGPPEPISELDAGLATAFLLGDGLTLYYSNRRTLDIYVVKRPHRNDPFGNGSPVVNINSNTADDGSPYLTQNDQVLYFTSSRTGNYDIYRSTRDASGAFDTPVHFMELGTATAVDAEPVVSADGLTVYWSTDLAVAGTAEIWVASRPSTSAAFTSPMRHGTLNTTPTAYDVPGWISADNCLFYISSTRTGSLGGTDIWVAKRPL